MASTDFSVLPPPQEILRRLQLDKDWEKMEAYDPYLLDDLFLTASHIRQVSKINRGSKESTKIIEGLLEAIRILSEIQDWKRVFQVLHLPLLISSKNTFYDQLGLWGHFDLQFRILEQIKEADTPDFLPFYLVNMARVSRNLGDIKKSTYYYLEAIQFHTKADNPREVGRLYHALAVSKLEEPKVKLAQKYLLTAIRLFEQLPTPDYLGLAQAYHNLSRVSNYYGDYEQSKTYYEKSIALYTQYPDMGPPENKAWVFHGYSDFLCEYGDYATAQLYGEKALPLFKDHVVGSAWCYARLAKLAYFRRCYAACRQYAIRSLDLFEQLNSDRGKVILFNTWYKLEIAERRFPQAAALLFQLLRLRSARKDHMKNAMTFEGFGRLAIELGDYELGVRLISKADFLNRKRQQARFAAERAELLAYAARARRGLGEETFERIWEGGQSRAVRPVVRLIKEQLGNYRDATIES
ncbi:MAG: tetratricopeptide repeat protein [Bacteroidota bacterium]